MHRFKKILKKICILTATNERYIQLLRRGGVIIGEDCVIDKSAEFGTEPYLVELGKCVRITKGVKFITHDGSLWVIRNLGLINENADFFGKIKIGENTNIGWNAIIMPGITIGKNCIIAAGAIVTKDIPDNSVVAGIPARIIETIEEYAAKKEPLCVLTKNMKNEAKKQYLMNLYRD